MKRFGTSEKWEQSMLFFRVRLLDRCDPSFSVLFFIRLSSDLSSKQPEISFLSSRSVNSLIHSLISLPPLRGSGVAHTAPSPVING